MATALLSYTSFVTLNPSTTLGPALLGALLTAFLYGISILQFYSYYRKCSSDHILMKGLLFILFLLDTTHFVGYALAIWFYGVTDYLNPLVLLDTLHWSVQFAYLSAILGEMVVNGIYSYKVYRLGGSGLWNTIFSIQIFSMGLSAVATGIVLNARLAKYSLPELSDKIGWLFYVNLSFQTSVNVEVACAISLFLWRMRTGIRRTDSLIHTLVWFTVNTMTLTSVVAIACIVAVALSPHTLIYLPILTMHPKTMINCLLAFLNSREIFKTNPKSELMSIHLSRIRFPVGQSSTNAPPPLSLPTPAFAPNAARYYD